MLKRSLDIAFEDPIYYLDDQNLVSSIKKPLFKDDGKSFIFTINKCSSEGSLLIETIDNYQFQISTVFLTSFPNYFTMLLDSGMQESQNKKVRVDFTGKVMLHILQPFFRVHSSLYHSLLEKDSALEIDLLDIKELLLAGQYFQVWEKISFYTSKYVLTLLQQENISSSGNGKEKILQFYHFFQQDSHASQFDVQVKNRLEFKIISNSLTYVDDLMEDKIYPQLFTYIISNSSIQAIRKTLYLPIPDYISSVKQRQILKLHPVSENIVTLLHYLKKVGNLVSLHVPYFEDKYPDHFNNLDYPWLLAIFANLTQKEAQSILNMKCPGSEFFSSWKLIQDLCRKFLAGISYKSEIVTAPFFPILIKMMYFPDNNIYLKIYHQDKVVYFPTLSNKMYFTHVVDKFDDIWLTLYNHQYPQYVKILD